MEVLSLNFIRVDFKESISEIRKIFLLYQYDGMEGFLLDEFTSREISGRFIQKQLIEKIVFDPFGNEETYTHTEYYVAEFSIFHKTQNEFILILKNPPKNTSIFLGNFRKFLGQKNKVRISAIEIDVFKFAEWLKDCKDIKQLEFLRLDINEIECSGVNIGNTALGKIHIKSNSKDISDAYFEFMANIHQNNHQADKIKFSVYFSNHKSTWIGTKNLKLRIQNMPNNILEKIIVNLIYSSVF